MPNWQPWPVASAASRLQYGRRRNANALPERGHIKLIEPILAIISVEKLLIFQLKWVIYMSKNIFCLIKTCALISNSLFSSVELGTFCRQLTLNASQTCVAEQKQPLLHINRTWKTRLRSRVEKLPCNCWAEQILKSGWTTAKKAYKITAISTKEIRKQENMKNTSNQPKFTKEEKSTVTINQGNLKNKELRRA